MNVYLRFGRIPYGSGIAEMPVVLLPSVYIPGMLQNRRELVADLPANQLDRPGFIQALFPVHADPRSSPRGRQADGPRLAVRVQSSFPARMSAI